MVIPDVAQKVRGDYSHVVALFVLEADWDVRCVSTGRETKNHTFSIARNREIAFSDLTTEVLCKIIKRRDSVEVTCKITVFGRVK